MTATREEKEMLQYERFEQWLMGYAELHWTVGEGGGVFTCPIATYLREITGSQEVKVEDAEILIKGGYEDTLILTPEWAQRFMQGVDDLFDDEEVPAIVALEVLQMFSVQILVKEEDAD